MEANEEDYEAYGFLVGDLPKLSPALRVVEDLAARQPLVLKSQLDQTWQWSTTIGYSTHYLWACQFCHHEQYAQVDVYGNPYNHQDEFTHADDCLWRRAKEVIGE